MSQLDAQALLVSLGVTLAFVLWILSVEKVKYSKWWWSLPLALIAPGFVSLYLKAVLG